MTPDLKLSIIILKRINNQLKNVKDSLQYTFDNKIVAYNYEASDDEIFKINTCLFGLTNYSFIWYVAFIDEFNDYFKSSDPIEQKQILLIKRKCKEYTKNIKDIFGDLKKSRNLVLAHGYRNKGKILTNEEINHHFDKLSHFDSPTPFLQISRITSLIIVEIEKNFSGVNENDIAL